MLLAIDPKAFQAACKILQEADLTPLLHRLKVPTLVVCGEFDQATPPALNKADRRQGRGRALCRIARLRPLPAARAAGAVPGRDQGILWGCNVGTRRAVPRKDRWIAIPYQRAVRRIGYAESVERRDRVVDIRRGWRLRHWLTDRRDFDVVHHANGRPPDRCWDITTAMRLPAPVCARRAVFHWRWVRWSGNARCTACCLLI